jgi:hypothetical protein
LAELVGELFVDLAAVPNRDNSKQSLLPINLIDDAETPHAVLSESCQLS